MKALPPMIDTRDLSERLDPTVAESAKSAVAERKAAEDQAFADKLAKRPPPNPRSAVASEPADQQNVAGKSPAWWRTRAEKLLRSRAGGSAIFA